jgi:hypothetical protein
LDGIAFSVKHHIETIGNKPRQNQLKEKHARALLLLNKQPEEQERLYQQSTGSNIPREEAIRIARSMKGQPTTQILKISHTNKEELIQKQEK